MAEVAPAFFTGYLYSVHAVACVTHGVDGSLYGFVKGRPATTGVVLSLREKERRVAAFTGVSAVLEMVVIFSSECPFGTLESEDTVFFRSQLGAPFSLGLDDFSVGVLLSFHNRFVLNRRSGLNYRWLLRLGFVGRLLTSIACSRSGMGVKYDDTMFAAAAAG